MYHWIKNFPMDEWIQAERPVWKYMYTFYLGQRHSLGGEEQQLAAASIQTTLRSSFLTRTYIYLQAHSGPIIFQHPKVKVCMAGQKRWELAKKSGNNEGKNKKKKKKISTRRIKTNSNSLFTSVFSTTHLGIFFITNESFLNACS